eukprot:8167445-Karenia_brevis.AAC.1
MRVVRRIHDCSRYDATAQSDAAVRHKYNIPSVDCLLQRKRLHYVARLLKHRPKSLITLLFSDGAGKRLPWTRLILEDLEFLRSDCLTSLPSPGSEYEAWLNFILNNERRWCEIVNSLHYTASWSDTQQVAPSPGVRSFVCQLCNTGQAFASSKALAQHQRVKHGVRNMM